MTWLCCCTYSSSCSNLSWWVCIYSTPEAACFPTCLSFILLHLWQWLSLFQYICIWLCYTGEQEGNQNIRTHFIAEILPSELLPLSHTSLFCATDCVCVCVCICRMLVPSLERVVPTSRGWGLTWVVCLVALAVPCAGGHIIQSLQSIVAFEREGERGKQQVKKRQSLSNLYALKKKFKKILESVVAATRWASSQPATHSQHPNRICHVMCYREIQSSLPHQWCSFYIEALFDCCCTLLAESW